MRENKGFINFFSQVLLIFGFVMICMLCFTILFGEVAGEISMLYTLGNKGIPVGIMFELLCLSIIIVIFKYMFFTELLFHQLSNVLRDSLMVLSTLITMCIFIVEFKWFPVNMWQPWVIFFICFAVCFVSSTVLSVLKEKEENKRLKIGLDNLKKEWEEKDGRSD